MIDKQPIVDWIRSYVHEAGREKVVVGISGGIDSTVVACLAVEALGKGNVIGVLLPFGGNGNPEALLLCNNLDIPYAIQDIYHEVDLFRTGFDDEGLGDPFEGEGPVKLKDALYDNKLMLGNIQARLRMIKLYTYAEMYNALVIGTTNKSEMMIGYFTKYGDGGVDFEPVADYWKSEIYDIAAQYSVIPPQIIQSAPSADLWQGQTDEDEIGLTYDQLYFYLNAAQEATPYDREEMEKVLKMQKATDHKRHTPPYYKRD